MFPLFHYSTLTPVQTIATFLQASENIRACSLISESLRTRNEEEGELLRGLEDLIEDLLFRLETIHHPRQSEEDSEEGEDDEEFDESAAVTVS